MNVLNVREAHRSARRALKEFNDAVRNRHYLAGKRAKDETQACGKGTDIYEQIIHIEGKLHKLITDLKTQLPKDEPPEDESRYHPARGG